MSTFPLSHDCKKSEDSGCDFCEEVREMALTIEDNTLKAIEMMHNRELDKAAKDRGLTPQRAVACAVAGMVTQMFIE